MLKKTSWEFLDLEAEPHLFDIDCKFSLPKLYNHASCTFQKESFYTIYIFGGKDDQGEYSNTIYSIVSCGLTLEIETVSIIGTIPETREKLTFSSDQKSHGLLYGGFKGEKIFSDVWVFNPYHKKFQSLDLKLEPRYGHSCCYFNNQYYIFGGQGNDEVLFNDVISVSIHDKTAKKIETTSAPKPRHSHACSMIGSVMFLFGGLTFQNYNEVSLNDLWSFNQFQWTEIKIDNPISRYGHYLCSLEKHNLLVLIGGFNTETQTAPKEVHKLKLKEMKWVVEEFKPSLQDSLIVSNAPIRKMNYGIFNFSHCLLHGRLLFYGGIQNKNNDLKISNGVIILETNLEDQMTYFGDYVMKRFLSSGGDADVYQVYKEDNEKKYFALKCIRVRKEEQPDYSSINMNTTTTLGSQLKEIMVQSKLSHKNCLQIIDSFIIKDTNQLCIVMPLCETDLGTFASNHDLEDAIPNEDMFLEIIIGILSGLSFMHSNKMIHMDLKPQNILLYREDKKYIPKIADFGLTNDIDTKINSKIGTNGYIAPEVAKDLKYSDKSDMYAIGLIFYYLLVCRSGKEAHISEKNLQEIQGYESSQKYIDLISKCLLENPDERISAAQMLKSLETIYSLRKGSNALQSMKGGKVQENSMLTRSMVQLNRNTNSPTSSFRVVKKKTLLVEERPSMKSLLSSLHLTKYEKIFIQEKYDLEKSLDNKDDYEKVVSKFDNIFERKRLVQKIEDCLNQDGTTEGTLPFEKMFDINVFVKACKLKKELFQGCENVLELILLTDEEIDKYFDKKLAKDEKETLISRVREQRSLWFNKD